MPTSIAPRVFISCTHESEGHARRVRALADSLFRHGVECVMDERDGRTAPPDGARWMEKQLEDANYVLVICSAVYLEAWEGTGATGRSADASLMIRDDAMRLGSKNTKYLPVLLSEDDLRFVPMALATVAHYEVWTQQGYDELYWRLTEQHQPEEPPLGKTAMHPLSFQAPTFCTSNGAAGNGTAKKMFSFQLVLKFDRASDRFTETDRKHVMDVVRAMLSPASEVSFKQQRGERVELVLEVIGGADVPGRLRHGMELGMFSEFDLLEAKVGTMNLLRTEPAFGHVNGKTGDAGAFAESVTLLLQQSRAGDKAASDRLASVIYHELRQVAANRLRAQRNQPFRTTELVQQAYVRVLARGPLEAVNRRHLFAIFKRAMRDLLIDHWRAQNAKKREGRQKRVPMTDIAASNEVPLDLIPELFTALDELEELHPEEAEVVSLKFLCGQSLDEISEMLGCTTHQVRTKWQNARKWLYARLQDVEDR